MPASFNGILDTVKRTITHSGDYTWATAPTWENYTSWVDYTGAGSPLLYQTEIIDLGSVKAVTPDISFSADGTARPLIEYSETSSDLSSKTVLGKYTDDNTITGTPQTHTILDYYENDYADQDSSLDQNYTPFKARYVRLGAFVENFGQTVTRSVPVLRRFNWRLKEEEVVEVVNNLAVSGEATVIPLSNIFFANNIQITVVDQAEKKLVPQIVSKDNKTIRVVDANTFSTAGVDAVVDVVVRGYPEHLFLRPYGLVSETP